MTLRWEEIIPRIITEAGLLPKNRQPKLAGDQKLKTNPSPAPENIGTV
jgi:hypothetical protein